MRLARFNIQPKGDDKRYFVGMPSPPAAGVLATTVFWYPVALQARGEALVALFVVLIPAALMVSRIRYRSFSDLVPEGRRSFQTLFVIAAVIAAVATHPEGVLLAMAYLYLVSGLVGLALGRIRRSAGVGAEPASSERQRSA